MIYICKAAVLPCQACSQGCSLCGKACEHSCSGCVKGCQACERGLSHGCHSACQAISDFWAPITKNPLGSYVIGTWLWMVLLIAATGRSLNLIISSTNVSCDKPKIFCAVDIGLALIHMAFAYYLQKRLIMAIGEKAAHEMTHKEVAEKARHLALYDIGFCFYTFVLIGCFVYNCVTIKDLEGCPDTGGVWMGSAGMILYCVLVWNFAFCWFCTQCCGGQISEVKGKHKAKPGSPDPQLVGAGATA